MFNWLKKLFAKKQPVKVIPPEVIHGAPVVAAPEPYIQNNNLAKASLDFAMKYVGTKELTGHNDGVFVNKIQEWVGGKAEYGQPWCAAFATWCLYNFGGSLVSQIKIPKSDSSTELYLFAKKNGLLLDTPIDMCIGLMKGDGGTAGKICHHTFRVISVNIEQGIVNSIDGNWGNAVSLTQHRIQDCYFVAVV
jgi:hypothetical protein